MNKNKMIGIASMVLAVAGIIVIFAYRAWLGGIIFLIAGIVADFALRANLKERTGEEYPNYVLAMFTEKKVTMPQYVMEAFKGQDIIEKILSCIVIALPFVIGVCIVLWITWDTHREVDAIYDFDY